VAFMHVLSHEGPPNGLARLWLSDGILRVTII